MTELTAEAAFKLLLDESSALLRAPAGAGLEFPEDELHRDILLPLLPALLEDAAIRKHWHARTATGFLARLRRQLQGGEDEPRWSADDFEIHVTASHSAGADARALADTLLSEEPLRDVAASLMNQLLDAVRSRLPAPAAGAVAAAAEAPSIAVQPGARPPLKIAAVRELVRFFRQTRRLIRTGRENPIRGSRTSHGGFDASGWSASYPLEGRRSRERRQSQRIAGPRRYFAAAASSSSFAFTSA